MAKSVDNPNVYQDVGSVTEPERRRESYENYRLEELGRFRPNIGTHKISGCIGCCHGISYTKLFLVGILVAVILGAFVGGIVLFVNAAKGCQCHYSVPDGSAADSQTSGRDRTVVSSYLKDTRTSTVGESVFLPHAQVKDGDKMKRYTAGSPYDKYGGTSSVLCLPKNPQYERFNSGRSYSSLRGAEYDSSDKDHEAIFDKRIKNHDIPCAVCEVTGRGTVRMFPALRQCFDGWTLEYSGYLMSSHPEHKHSMDTICLDGEPETLDGGSKNLNGARFYFVEADGQLPMPPYIEDAQLTCVVCSK